MSFIQPQLKDNVVASLRSIILKMQKANRLFYIGEMSEESYEIEKEDFHSELASIIKDRFGIKIKPKEAGFFAIYPIFDIDKIENLTNIKSGANKNRGITDAGIKTDVKKAIKNAREFKKWLDKGTVVIDVKNAYIEKIPASIVITMYTSITDIGYGNKDDLTADELVAVILHEIGHVFNSLEAYTNVHHTTQSILDAFLENKFSYVKELGITTDSKDPHVIDAKNKKDVVIKVYQDLDKNVSNVLLGQKGIAETNSEFEADTFVVRFGLADKLTSALVKLKDIKSYQFRLMPIMIVAGIIKFMLSSLISGLVLIFTGSLALYVTVGLTLFMLSLTVKIIFLFALNTFTRLPNLDEHGTMLTRLEAIKLRTIQMLRRSDISQKEKEKLLVVLDNIDDDADLVDKSMADSILATLFDIFSAPNLSIESNLSMLVDKLINNGLWVKSVKFKKLLRNIGQESYVAEYNKYMADNFSDLLIGEEDSVEYQGSGDPIVKDLIAFYKKVTDNNVLKNIKDYFKLAEEMSELIRKRFGLKIYVLPAYRLSGGFASLPFRITKAHPFFKDNQIVQYSLPLSIGGVIGYMSYSNDMSLINNLSTGKVNLDVDLKKGYISGLGDYANFLFIEFGRDILLHTATYKTTKRYALTPEELTAVTLHEIGHLFTYLKELKASVISNTILRDKFLTIKENVDKFKITGDDIAVKETREDMTGFINVTKNLFIQYTYIFTIMILGYPDAVLGGKIKQKIAEAYTSANGIPVLGTIRQSMTMSETEADNFAVMFGMAKPLTTALEKYLQTVSKSYFKQIMEINMFMILKYLTSSLRFALLPIVVVVILVETIIRSIFSAIRIISGDYFPYEKFPNRIKRMKQDLIKILRTEKLPQKIQDDIIEQIDFLYKEVKLLEDSAAGSILANIFALNPSYGKDITIEQRQIDMLMDLIENDTWYLGKKFEQLLKNK